MKYHKWLHILTVTLILGLLVLALPAAPALAAYDEEIDLDPDEGEIGDEVEVTGDDFDKSYYIDDTDYEYYYVTVYFSSEEAEEGDEIGDEVENYERVDSSQFVDEYGEWETSFDIPDELTDGDDDEDVTGGDYYVYVTYNDSYHTDDKIVAVAEFTVISAEIELYPDEGVVGTEVEITGVDFLDYEDITVEFDGDEIDIESGDDETDRYGDFVCTVIIPEATAGDHTITVTDDSDAYAEAEFTVEPEITLSESKAASGDSVTVYGTGFGDEVEVTIELDGDEVADDETDSYGNFQVSFTVPVLNAGTYEIEAKDDDKNKDEVDFTMAAGVTLSKTTGNVGDTITVSGSGFTPNSSVTIVFATDRTTTTADANGRISASISVPAIQSGSQTITVSDGSSTVRETFDVEATPPSAPDILLPLDGEKAKSKATLDWSDVTDPSLPVTYNLQVATDAGFSNIVLQKSMLDSSEYTLTEEEALESTDQETPYYLRVQAVDGANNQSSWSSAVSFYVGFSFGSLGWFVYVLVGIAVLLIVLIAYLLVLRTRRI